MNAGQRVESNRDKWSAWHSGVETPRPYGSLLTYEKGAAYLSGLDLVEDWGCGLGWFRKYFAPGRYRGIDGTWTPFADQVADLVEYTSDVDGVFMRHVLEHNYAWQQILANAVQSFRRRMVLVLFTPFSERTWVLDTPQIAEGVRVPNISFAKRDLIRCFKGLSWTLEEGLPGKRYGIESIFYLCKPSTGDSPDQPLKTALDGSADLAKREL